MTPRRVDIAHRGRHRGPGDGLPASQGEARHPGHTILEKEPEVAAHGGTRLILHVRSAPSPAATASFAIGRELATRAIERFELA